MFVWVSCLLHSSLCVFPFLKNLLSLSSTASQHILDRFLSIEISSLGLDSFSIDSHSIEISGFSLDSFSTASRQLLRSIKPNFFALCLLNRLSTDCWSIEVIFAVDKSSTAPQQIHLCWDLVLNRFLIETLIHRDAFSIYRIGTISDLIFSLLSQ